LDAEAIGIGVSAAYTVASAVEFTEPEARPEFASPISQ
jgi:hypothetical protein